MRPQTEEAVKKLVNWALDQVPLRHEDDPYEDGFGSECNRCMFCGKESAGFMRTPEPHEPDCFWVQLYQARENQEL